MGKLITMLFLLLYLGIHGTLRSQDQDISKMHNPAKEIIVDGLSRPWSMAFLSEEEVLLSEKDGDLLFINIHTKEKRPIKGFPQDRFDTLLYVKENFKPLTFPASLPDSTKVTFNAGILEVVLDPDFKNNRQVYMSYVARGEGGTTTKVIRAELRNDSLTQIRPLFVATPFSEGLFHYGGGITFGPDGKLYITVGERVFNELDEPALPVAQDVTDRRGKIYRLNPDGSIPDDNPDFGPDAVPGIYALGIRAAQGITLQPNTGKIWFSEHGTRQGDEINILRPGNNYGWPVVTSGGYRSSEYQPPTIEGVEFANPVWYWLQTVAPTGLCFYTGNEFPSWKNNLIVPGLSRGSLWRVRVEGETVKSMEELFVDDRERSRKAVMSPKGKLYILTEDLENRTNGKIVRIKPE
ncbi:PQQ-dependent sugar dehydrogenase [Flavobacteriaceae bacterium TP-CH-4]|uniref:PQQ-dependent sugar dehydrogenase n=1 Tax=Pelagihabitans pacificus TaxID=2696054 RepID=A0A967E7Q0_9FLAO|nr:PQQ-dependent sugar dehydrogenase [Pelagihabitans pacificus]NHF60484.1 PQQ-dependent sugar dehydrogenase [Pelagihabitans pacificus]